jgi:hypothetical protein
LVVRLAVVAEVVSVLSLVQGCALGQIAGTTNKVEPLQRRVSTYVVKGDEFKIVEHEQRDPDHIALIAIQRKNLNRTQLRALARHLAGDASHPAVELLTSSQVYAACIKTRWVERPEGPDPESSDACERGKVLTVEASDAPVLHWGSAAPNY